MVYDNDGPIYSMLNGKPCAPCTEPQTELGWSYQGYPSQAACEAAGQTYCCECINTG